MSRKKWQDQCRQWTILQDAQIHFLDKISTYLKFASSVANQEVILFTRTKDGALLLLGHEGGTEEFRQLFKIGTIKSALELPLWSACLEKGKNIEGQQEISLGQMAKLHIYPIKDSGGKVVGAISFLDKQDLQKSALLAEMAYMSIMVPDEGSEQLYEPLHTGDGLIIFDASGIILYANETAGRLVNLLGFDRRLSGTSIYQGSLKLSLVKRTLANHRGMIDEELYDTVILAQYIIPLVSGGKLKGAYLILRDRTLERKAEQELRIKNSVIKEIHHRVKNNLQTVAGLLRMQARRADSVEITNALLEGIHRIESMSLVHEILCHYDKEYVDIKTICDELLRLLHQSISTKDQKILTIYEGPKILLSSDQASYLALVINELISNAFKHAFINKKEGLIFIETKLRDEQVTIHLTDNGKGIEEGVDLFRTERLGLQIVRNLIVDQLNGTIQCKRNIPQGTSFIITFKKEA